MIKLTPRERDVLCACELDAGRSVTQIAALLKARPSQVAYTLRRLRQRGILGPQRPSFNVYVLGYSDFAFFFSLGSAGRKQRGALLEQIGRSPVVSWCAEIGGPYQYALSILSKHPDAVQKYLKELSSSLEGNISGDLAIRVMVRSYGRKYLSPVARRSSTLWFGGAPGSFSLDATDCRILERLSAGIESSWREVSKACGLSTSLVQRRIHCCEKAGLINGYYYSVDPTRMGIQVYNLLVKCRGLTAKLGGALEQFCRKHPRVVHFIECLGSWSFEVVMECEQAEDAAETARELYDRFGGDIAAIEILPVFRYVKAALFPFRAAQQEDEASGARAGDQRLSAKAFE